MDFEDLPKFSKTCLLFSSTPLRAFSSGFNRDGAISVTGSLTEVGTEFALASFLLYKSKGPL